MSFPQHPFRVFRRSDVVDDGRVLPRDAKNAWKPKSSRALISRRNIVKTKKIFSVKKHSLIFKLLPCENVRIIAHKTNAIFYCNIAQCTPLRVHLSIYKLSGSLYKGPYWRRQIWIQRRCNGMVAKRNTTRRRDRGALKIIQKRIILQGPERLSPPICVQSNIDWFRSRQDIDSRKRSRSDINVEKFGNIVRK